MFFRIIPPRFSKLAFRNIVKSKNLFGIRDNLRQAFVESAPVMAGYVPIGAAFGFLAVQSGLPAWFVLASSVLVYAGASQFAMIPMIVAGLPVLSIAFATFVINLRHVFYTIALLDRLQVTGFTRWYCAFSLTDETFSLVAALPKDASIGRIATLSSMNQFWWVLGTVLGVMAGSAVQFSLSGLDFVLCALFAMLATEQWRVRQTSLPLWCALVFYPIARWAVASEALLIAIALCSVSAVLWGEYRKKGDRYER